MTQNGLSLATDAQAQQAATLRRGLESLGLNSGAGLEQKLLSYLNLLQRWNRAYNLSSVRDPVQMVIRHVLDSLTLVPHIEVLVGKAVDVGTGAGLPGAVLAMAFPHRNFCLVDSGGKKTRFLFQVKTELGLDNMAVHNSRVEDYCPEQKFELVLSRAFSNLAHMVMTSRHLLVAEGRFLAMKGRYPHRELAELPADIEVLAVHELQVPGLREPRHLVELRG